MISILHVSLEHYHMLKHLWMAKFQCISYTKTFSECFCYLHTPPLGKLHLALIHYAHKRLTARSREASTPRDSCLDFFNRSKILQLTGTSASVLWRWQTSVKSSAKFIYFNPSHQYIWIYRLWKDGNFVSGLMCYKKWEHAPFHPL